ncbi:hypothetical protein RNAN_0974 [Rheinheimera nanhaiensis E407-8]|uniref:Uncharacterized protein n=1 Tax=Rheinheimera nanhaiensis E407-8 TaxID=562729 RepID=I1DVC5_9GAMM|nr:hypothetical protein RNAN_0974 [Rheinheimera nanhaiensis E407-8]
MYGGNSMATCSQVSFLKRLFWCNGFNADFNQLLWLACQKS